jgi:glycosyltransferase involved in cell wall biosynthesis
MKSGPLAGLTVLRFAHSYDSGGGTERYLDDLDGELLQRNAMTIVRLHLTRASPAGPPLDEPIGQGRLIRIPLPVISGSQSAPASEETSWRFRFKQRVRNWVLYNPVVWRLWGARWAANYRLRPEPGQAIAAGAAAAAVFRDYPVALAVLHFFGGSDADEIVVQARKAGVPFVVLNHYSNDRFLHLGIRKHASLADGIAGVNGLEVPAYARPGFANLSDGVDTEFLSRIHARPLKTAPKFPLVLLPARVIREKGQMDLLRAVISLRQSGVQCGIAFAGRVDSSDFVAELRQKIADAGMTEFVAFLGNLSLEELRDWYAASTVVAFPTYHHEGLGRVIVEALAVGTPVIAYATGGVPEAIVEGRTGYLVKTGDIAGLTVRLRELLTVQSVREGMAKMGRADAEERFSLGALADRHERFYQRVIADYKSSSHGPRGNKSA